MKDPRRIAEQNAAYRQGVVLGLTMAEAGILIIFVLLLLIGFNEWRQAVERRDAIGKVAVEKVRLAHLETADRALSSIAEAMQVSNPVTEERMQLLVRAVREAVSTPQGESALQEARDAIKELNRIQDELRATGVSIDQAKRIEQQSFRIANQEGQLKLLQSKLEAAGLGKGERPCWVKPDGTIDFLFDVVLGSDGIRMRENVIQERAKERALLPMPQTDPSEVLTEGEFLRRTAPLYDSSLAANCRFFVTVFDSTAPTEKDLYKSLLRTVEGHFYKRLSSGRSPF